MRPIASWTLISGRTVTDETPMTSLMRIVLDVLTRDARTQSSG
jgi:hypothetical protein